MTTNYSGVPGNVLGLPATVPEPADGDPNAAATFASGFQKLTDFIAMLRFGAQAAQWQPLFATSGIGANINAVAFNGSQSSPKVIATSNAVLYVSTTDFGRTWTTQALAGAPGQIAYLNGLWLCGAAAGQVATSPDGVTWTARTATNASWGGAQSCAHGFAYGAGLYVGLASNGVVTSPDGVTWTNRTIATLSGAALCVWFADGRFVLGSAGGVIFTSTDGITWTSTLSGSSAAVYDVVYSAPLDLWLAVGAAGHISSSPDGVTWTHIGQPTGTADLVRVDWGSGQFATSTGSAVYSSTDGGTTFAARSQTSRFPFFINNQWFVGQSTAPWLLYGLAFPGI